MLCLEVAVWNHAGRYDKTYLPFRAKVHHFPVIVLHQFGIAEVRRKCFQNQANNVGS